MIKFNTHDNVDQKIDDKWYTYSMSATRPRDYKNATKKDLRVERLPIVSNPAFFSYNYPPKFNVEREVAWTTTCCNQPTKRVVSGPVWDDPTLDVNLKRMVAYPKNALGQKKTTKILFGREYENGPAPRRAAPAAAAKKVIRR
jgi:hypothetical protein